MEFTFILSKLNFEIDERRKNIYGVHEETFQ